MKRKKMKQILLTLALSAICTSTVLAEDYGPKAIYTVDDATITASRVSYDYFDGSLYNVNTKIGYATDIELHPGENLIGVIGGDTTRWSLEKAKVGDTSHIYIKPLVDNANTDIVINTDKRSYRLLVKSTNYTYNPIISFYYAEDRAKKLASIPIYSSPEEKEFLDVFTENKDGQFLVKKMNYSYTFTSDKKLDKELVPLKIFDDGTRTYIQMPRNRYDLPVLYNVDDSTKKATLNLVNYRVNGQYFIADRIFKHAKLLYSSTAKWSVDIVVKKMEGGNVN